MRELVYIASPYTQGDTAINVKTQIDAAHRLMDMGYAPLAPLLSHYLHIHRARPYKDWIDLDNAMLVRCDVLLRLPGNSKGADDEVRLAESCGIIVLYGWNHFYKYHYK